MDDLKDKRVLVTGASTGIGAAVAIGFGAAGAAVGVHYNASRAEAEAVAATIRNAGGRAELLQADVRDGAATRALIHQAATALGGLDVLINNAGHVIKRTLLDDLDEALFDELVDLNMRSVFVATQEAVRLFVKQGHGNIINTTSISARMGGGPGVALYAGTKGFVSAFTRNVARELAPKGIRCNAVSPGVIETPLHARLTAPTIMETMRQAVPMGRLGVPEECVGAYLYFASDRLSGYVTGQVLEVNGGQLMV
ncbi:MAG: SDR family oxidoreductase [Alphaproteobacteria bacterium]|nr:SDR family oxidoreductase [Alphaproteobacteria bacterium]